MNKEINETLQGTATLVQPSNKGGTKKLFLESYGCAMNFSDSEVVAAILKKEGYETTRNFEEADVILVNTCSIRDKAEQTVRQRLHLFKKQKKSKPGLIIGVLGCMAERLKETLLEQEKLVDLVVGPDAYRDLPNLLQGVEGGQRAVNVLLSREETYAEISPVRLSDSGVTAFISITRGCDNMCSFCVVPFTRGRERSRNPLSIVAEARELVENGYKEVTLLGQNVDSYRWNISKKGEIENPDIPTTTFAQLLEMVAKVSPELRVRFSTSHPKDMTDEVLYMMAKYKNICDYIHLPIQSGSNEMLKKMNRNHTVEWYLERIQSIQRIIPNCGISTDIIAGFCDETEEDHQDTMKLFGQVKFNLAYMYYYSERPKTLAERKFEDNVPLDIKKKRLSEIVAIHRQNALEENQKTIGKTYEVLVEGVPKKNKEQYSGRTTENFYVVFPKEGIKKGEYINVKIIDCSSATLIGEVIN
jgi:tRNA-2-methylthio-N6-dimethylallyladenosine synthase